MRKKAGLQPILSGRRLGEPELEAHGLEWEVWSLATIEMWTFVVEAPLNLDLTGFNVEATDGSIGKVDEATRRPAAASSSSTPVPGSSARRSCFRPV